MRELVSEEPGEPVVLVLESGREEIDVARRPELVREPLDWGREELDTAVARPAPQGVAQLVARGVEVEEHGTVRVDADLGKLVARLDGRCDEVPSEVLVVRFREDDHRIALDHLRISVGHEVLVAGVPRRHVAGDDDALAEDAELEHPIGDDAVVGADAGEVAEEPDLEAALLGRDRRGDGVEGGPRQPAEGLEEVGGCLAGGRARRGEGRPPGVLVVCLQRDHRLVERRVDLGLRRRTRDGRGVPAGSSS